MSSGNNLSCARCHKPQAGLSAPLRRCARCRATQYCSTDCQKAAWSQHKKQCRNGHLDTANCVQRSTYTLDMSKILARDNASKSNVDTIFHLRISIPHLMDISMSGPFYPLEAIVPQVLHNFGDECSGGREAFQELVRDVGITAFQRISSPINGNSNKVKTIELIREYNPAVAGKLPAPTWVVVSAVIADMSPGSETEFVPTEEMNFHGTFDSVNAATSAAKKIGKDLADNYSNGQFLEMQDSIGDSDPASGTACYNGMATGLDRNSKKTMAMVQVRYEAALAT